MELPLTERTCSRCTYSSPRSTSVQGSLRVPRSSRSCPGCPLARCRGPRGPARVSRTLVGDSVLFLSPGNRWNQTEKFRRFCYEIQSSTGFENNDLRFSKQTMVTERFLVPPVLLAKNNIAPGPSKFWEFTSKRCEVLHRGYCCCWFV